MIDWNNFAWFYQFVNGIKVQSTYWPKERNTSKLSNYQLNKLRKNV